ncbi:MAG: hypothetical protein ACKO96_47785 [Flammeovirgaceae bacterium]
MSMLILPTLSKWRVYSVKVLSINGDACNYKTLPSDFYFTPTNTTCQDDDIYDFSSLSLLTINHGTNKCNYSEPNSETKQYKKQGDTLIINGENYGVVLLSRDTLILDNCSKLNISLPTPVNQYGKIGMKFIRIQ